MSVAQADEVIIALPGDKSKMSIYEKTPPERGLISTGGFTFCGDLGMLPLLLVLVFIAEVVAVDGHQVFSQRQAIQSRFGAPKRP